MRNSTRTLIIGPATSPVVARPISKIGALYYCPRRGCGAVYYKPAISNKIPARRFRCDCGQSINDCDQKTVGTIGDKPFTVKATRLSTSTAAAAPAAPVAPKAAAPTAPAAPAPKAAPATK